MPGSGAKPGGADGQWTKALQIAIGIGDYHYIGTLAQKRL